MGKKRNSEKPPDIPVNAEGNVVVAPEANGQAPPANGDAPASTPAALSEPPRNRPVAGFVAHSDRTTRLEVAVWGRQVRPAAGEEYTQYSLTLNRSWRNTDGTWSETATYRAHDVPVLLYLIGQAHDWCVAQRTVFRTNPGEELPF